ncbi:NAD(P)/FAD-dependent oxidoreductase [Flagellimonas algicola]|uniref:NAD(P)/FAD-dependent oxidoreductase n=1 Tax=Flagellimonas algicola TaxID=2583815 RepID=A0ABY2WPK4_9FLAO|nr:NAD(P)/FAD-dependent oxidoreductase [Allomuricauda algicola]TMU56591.1 NAD(P)/FAD-dependent oxidoreductase [Allomuricauda algicola]
MKNTDVLIIGGGLAGLTAAVDLASKGIQVVVVEKKTYPRHKVCGEYVSNEVKPYLEHLGMDFATLSLPQIDTLQLSTQLGKSVSVKLPLGGFGMSRYALDNQLYQLALRNSVEFVFSTVTAVDFKEDEFEVSLASKSIQRAKVVLGAFGKRSNLDEKFQLRGRHQKSPWLGVKCHYHYDGHPKNLVSLHNFQGGYAGLSQVEESVLNLCYLVRYDSFKRAGNIHEFNRQVLCRNPYLKQFLEKAKPIFDYPLSIAQISFGKKLTVANHILMCGDSAGMIHPLCGNGMAMAMHAAKMASEQVTFFLKDQSMDRRGMEEVYQKQWNKHFKKRIWLGSQLQRAMLHTGWFNFGMRSIANSKLMLQTLIKRTHGNPILS